MNVTIEEARIPTTLDGPDNDEFLQVCALSDAIAMDLRGNLDLSSSPAQKLAQMQRNPYWDVKRFIALQGDNVVGFGAAAMPTKEDLDRAYVDLAVHPEHRGGGIGTQLLNAVVQAAQQSGRRILNADCGVRADALEALEADPGVDFTAAKSGTGKLPTNDAGVRFALKHGFELEQVERESVLHIGGLTGVAEKLDGARRKAGTDYEVSLWQGRTPEEFEAGMVTCYEQMSRDIPMAGLDFEPEIWDVGRLRHNDERAEKTGTRRHMGIAVHVPTQDVVAYTYINTHAGRPEAGIQEDTFVLKAHRGHGLGNLVKLANLQQVLRNNPAVKRITTWNAQENSHMLDINVGLGFRPFMHEGQWQRRD